MRYLKLFLCIWFLLAERIKGTKTVYEINSPENALGSLRGYSVRGYEISIFCQRKEYAVVYDKWYVPNFRRATYRVVGVVTNDAPAALKRACEAYVDLPAFINERNFNSEIRRSIVNAYLDLLEKKFDAKST